MNIIIAIIISDAPQLGVVIATRVKAEKQTV